MMNNKTEFLKQLTMASYGKHKRTVYADFISLVASELCIENKAKMQLLKDRKRIISNYKEKELLALCEMFQILVDILEQNPFQDFLGSIYMELELGNKNTGQFFTPYCLASLTARMQAAPMLQNLEDQKWISASDPCCGSCGMLIALAETLYQSQINYQQRVLFVGQDIDYMVGLMGFVQLSLIGAAGYIVLGDTLTNPCDWPILLPPKSQNILCTPMFYHNNWIDIKLNSLLGL